jgi:hypothetical protein
MVIKQLRTARDWRDGIKAMEERPCSLEKRSSSNMTPKL